MLPPTGQKALSTMNGRVGVNLNHTLVLHMGSWVRAAASPDSNIKLQETAIVPHQ